MFLIFSEIEIHSDQILNIGVSASPTYCDELQEAEASELEFLSFQYEWIQTSGLSIGLDFPYAKKNLNVAPGILSPSSEYTFKVQATLGMYHNSVT